MEGEGSTRWGDSKGRTAVESCPSITLKDVSEEATSGRMERQQGIFRHVILTAEYYLEKIDEDEKELSLTPKDGPLQNIRITRTHTWPRQWFLICSYCEGHEEKFRRLKLFILDGLAGCRTCHNLDYLSHLRDNYKKHKTGKK